MIIMINTYNKYITIVHRSTPQYTAAHHHFKALVGYSILLLLKQIFNYFQLSVDNLKICRHYSSQSQQKAININI